jgi:hypothetical protein
LAVNTTLRDLNLAGNSANAQANNRLVRVMSINTTLRKLGYPSAQINAELIMNRLAPVLTTNSALTELRFDCNAPLDRPITALLNRNKHNLTTKHQTLFSLLYDSFSQRRSSSMRRSTNGQEISAKRPRQQ